MKQPYACALLLCINLSLLVTAGGCADTHAARQPTTPPDECICYRGTSELHLPGGRNAPGGASVVRRTVSAARGVITEEVVAPAGPGGGTREFVVDMTVNGDKLTLAERSNAFVGSGTLEGSAWAWNAWTTESILPAGTRVTSRDTRTADTLTAEKQVFAPDGTAQLSITETYQRISNDEFESTRATMRATHSEGPQRPASQPGGAH